MPATTSVISPWGIATSLTEVITPLLLTTILALTSLLPYVPAVTPLSPNVNEGAPGSHWLEPEL